MKDIKTLVKRRTQAEIRAARMATVTTSGRPQSNSPASDPENQESSTKRERLPVSPTFKPDFAQLRSYWKELDQEWPGRVMGYLYRYFPRLNRPDPHYIDKFTEPLESEQEILQKWGTGVYEVRLYDSNFRKGNELCKSVVKFKESYSERPPVLDPIELDVGHSDNRSYLEWRRSNNMPVPGDANRNGMQDGRDVAVKALADIAKSKQDPQETVEGGAAAAAFKIVTAASDHAIQTVKAQSDPTAMLKIVEAVQGKGNGNAEFFTTLLKVQADASAQQTALITKLLERPNGNNELVALIVKVQADAAANQTAMTKSMFEFMAAQKKDSGSGGIAGLKETVETIATVADLIGGGGGRSRGNGGWVDAVLSNPMVGRLGDFLGTAAVNWSQAQMMRTAREVNPGAALQPGAAAGRTPAATPDGTVIYPGDPPPQPPAQLSEDAINQQFLMDFFIPRHLSFIDAIEHGIPGDEFADRLYEVDQMMPHGSGMTLGQHAQIKAIGKEKLVQLLGMAALANPNLKAMLAGKQSLVVQFLEQFLAWEPEDSVPPPPGMDKD